MNNTLDIKDLNSLETPIKIIRTIPKRAELKQELIQQQIGLFFILFVWGALGWFTSIFTDSWFWIIVIALFNPLSLAVYAIMRESFKIIKISKYVLGKHDEFLENFLFLEINQDGFSVFSAEQKLLQTINFKNIQKITIKRFNRTHLNFIKIIEKNSEKFYLEISFFEIFHININNETKQLTAHHICHLLNNFYQQSKLNA